MAKSSVQICYAHGGTVRTQFMESIIRTLAAREAILSLSGQQGLYVDDNRNVLAQRFLQNSDDEWLWMLDTDIAFEPGVLTHLLEDADRKERPIVSAMYLSDFGDYVGPVWYMRDEDGFHAMGCIPNFRRVKLDGIGMGCCLIHRSALERIQALFADDPWPWFGRDIIDTDRGPEHLGEDLSFCHRAAQADIPIWGSGIAVGHLKGRTITLKDFTAPTGDTRQLPVAV